MKLRHDLSAQNDPPGRIVVRPLPVRARGRARDKRRGAARLVQFLAPPLVGGVTPLVLDVRAERIGFVLQGRGDPRGDEHRPLRRAIRRGAGRVGDVARAATVVVVLWLGRLARDRSGCRQLQGRRRRERAVLLLRAEREHPTLAALPLALACGARPKARRSSGASVAPHGPMSVPRLLMCPLRHFPASRHGHESGT